MKCGMKMRDAHSDNNQPWQWQGVHTWNSISPSPFRNQPMNKINDVSEYRQTDHTTDLLDTQFSTLNTCVGMQTNKFCPKVIWHLPKMDINFQKNWSSWWKGILCLVSYLFFLWYRLSTSLILCHIFLITITFLMESKSCSQITKKGSVHRVNSWQWLPFTRGKGVRERESVGCKWTNLCKFWMIDKVRTYLVCMMMMMKMEMEIWSYFE